MYYIYDETGLLMRKVRYKAEAIELVKLREDWSYVFVKVKKNYSILLSLKQHHFKFHERNKNVFR